MGSGRGVVLSERVCDGGIRWLAPSNEARKRNEKRKTGKGGGRYGYATASGVGDGGERGGEKDAAAGVLRHCRRQSITAFEVYADGWICDFLLPALPFKYSSLSPLLLVFSLYLPLKVFPQGFGLFALVLFCLLIPHFNDLSTSSCRQ